MSSPTIFPRVFVQYRGKYIFVFIAKSIFLLLCRIWELALDFEIRPENDDNIEEEEEDNVEEDKIFFQNWKDFFLPCHKNSHLYTLPYKALRELKFTEKKFNYRKCGF